MKQAENQVREFMEAAEQECPTKPCIPSQEVRILRAKLILEEALETIDALGVELRVSLSDEKSPFRFSIYKEMDLEQVADGCADIKVVTIGTEIACGIPSEEVWEEVHRSNMSKFIDGFKEPGGKWNKGKSWTPPNLKPILNITEHDGQAKTI